MNSVVLIGRLTNEPELSYTPNTQTAIAHFTMAVDRMKKDDGADFIRITVFGKQAENCDKYLGKGRQVAVNGRIQTGKYENDEGKTVYTTDIIADRVEFIGNNSSVKKDTEPSQEHFEGVPTSFEEAVGVDSFEAAEDDLPFM